MITVTLLESSLVGLQAAIGEYSDVADVFEIRLDAMSEPAEAIELRKLTAHPLIATCRRPEDGGTFRGPENERHRLLASCAHAGFDLVDIEEDRDFEVSEDRLVRSIHDFHRTPPHARIVNRLRPLAERGAVVKWASRVRTFNDTLQVLIAARELHRLGIRYAAMGMGDFPRALTRLMGARLIYGAGRRPAPHQPASRSIRALLDHWGNPRAKADTYLVVGSPVEHSLSPRIHNAAFEATGVDAAYGALEIDHRRDLKRTLAHAEHLDLRGLSVTAPLKQAAYEVAGQATPEAERARAANTIRIGDDGVEAHNTDGLGTQDILRGLMQGAGRPNVLMVGAGGAARGLCSTLMDHELTVATRRQATREAFSADFDVPVVDLPTAHARLSEMDLVINATPAAEPLALDGYKGAVYDLNYGRDPTPWERHARDHGLPLATGRDLLLAQAIHAFTWWTGKPAPVQAMQSALGGSP